MPSICGVVIAPSGQIVLTWPGHSLHSTPHGESFVTIVSLMGSHLAARESKRSHFHNTAATLTKDDVDRLDPC